MSYLLGQYSPYTITVALLDTTDPASLLTLHLYMCSPIVSVVSVVYDRLLIPLIGVQLLPEPLSQEYISVPPPVVARHIRVVAVLTGMVVSDGCSVIDGEPVKYETFMLQTISRKSYNINLISFSLIQGTKH